MHLLVNNLCDFFVHESREFVQPENTARLNVLQGIENEITSVMGSSVFVSVVDRK